MQDFGTKADDTAGPSGQLSASEFNNLATELENAVLRSGLVLNGASVTQLASSIFMHGVKAQTFQDSGAANAYVATPVSGSGGVLLPADYSPLDGTVISFQAANTNSGASTLNIGQTTGTLLGAKAILGEGGAAIAANTIFAGQYLQLRYDSSLSAGVGAWVLMPWARSAFVSSGLVVFSAAGVTSWTVPEGVKRVKVTVIGGGGGGAKNAAASAGPGGGGGGGIAIKMVSLIGTSSVSVTVGAGGAGATIDGNDGVAGGASSFGAFCSATGGSGGLAASGGGAGGVGSSGDINASVGSGGVSTRTAADTGAQGGYGGGGSSAGGTAGTTLPASPGNGGAGRITTTAVAGSPGIVVIEW